MHAVMCATWQCIMYDSHPTHIQLGIQLRHLFFVSAHFTQLIEKKLFPWLLQMNDTAKFIHWYYYLLYLKSLYYISISQVGNLTNTWALLLWYM